MSTEPTLALQAAIVAALKADSSLTGLIAGRVYDRIPNLHQFPYIRVGDSDEDLPDLADCIDGSEIFSTLHAFSRPQEDATNATQPRGKVEVKRIAGAAKRAIHGANLSLEDNRLILIEHYRTVFLTDPDGLTEHAIIMFRALTEPT